MSTRSRTWVSVSRTEAPSRPVWGTLPFCLIFSSKACSVCLSLHAAAFNWCCQKGYPENVFNVFGKGSYGLGLVPDSIFVLA